MGPAPRGGAYTYDWIENLLGLGMHSVDRVLPEFQAPQVGDTIGYGSNRMRVERVEPEHVLAWRSGRQLGLDVRPRGARRVDPALFSRNRFRLPSLAARVGMIPMEPASLVMSARCCRASRSGPSACARTDGSESHGPGWIRTTDGIKSPLLYQLSYRPAQQWPAADGYPCPAAPID